MADSLGFRPDYAVPPGATLEETLASLGMTQGELARRMGRPLKTINEIIKGKATITAATALQLERVLGVPARVWSNLESQYQEALARIEQRASLEGDVSFLERVPWKHLVKAGWLPKLPDPIDQLDALLRYFGLSSIDGWEEIYESPGVAYRGTKAFSPDAFAVAAWLRRGEIEGRAARCQPYGRKAFLAVLARARDLTRKPVPEIKGELVRLCAEAGVALVVVPELPGTRLSGATRWLAPDRALIQLSERYNRADTFWFTFFHEAGHLILHGKRRAFVDGASSNDQAAEDEANAFAAEKLIPGGDLQAFLGLHPKPDRHAIVAFSRRIGVAPGVVVGRLQFDKVIGWDQFNDLRVALR